MKIKAIEALCKAEKKIKLAFDRLRKIQWCITEGAVYPLYGMPPLDADSVYIVFDIPADKKSGIPCETDPLPPSGFDYSDATADELVTPPPFISVNYGGGTYLPFNTPYGTVFINDAGLKPFAGGKNITFCARKTKNGAPYIAVKEGLLLSGILLPADIVNDKLVTALTDAADGAERYLFNRDTK